MKPQHQKVAVLAATALISIGVLAWYLRKVKKEETPGGESSDSSSYKKPRKSPTTSSSSQPGQPALRDGGTVGTATSTVATDEKAIHTEIEELDKKGKVFFKEKEFLKAADAFSEALELIADHMTSKSTSLKRQKITLLNNRSAMYEKAGCLDLAIDDCNLILEMENQHGKARPRKLRILESQNKWQEALQEVCASQLLYMQENKAYMQNGLPMPPAPIPASKLEEILLHVVDMEKDKYLAQMQYPMPGKFTITQLLKSYSSYNDWTKTAKNGPTVSKLTNQLQDAKNDNDKVPLLYRRALRYALEREYEMATVDFELAFSIVTATPDLIKSSGIDHVDLMEWVGMVRHWHFKLDSALECLQQAARMDPNRAGLLVKQAGVQLDAGKTDESLKLLEQALIIDPDCVDAMLHRSNLRIMQSKPEMAKADLERCLRLQPKHVMAQLRLATVLVSLNDPEGASRRIDQLTSSNETEVYSYRGELAFTQGRMDEARMNFEKAMELDATNPTPYVNAAMVILNSPPQQFQMPDTNLACSLLEKAISIDPQFSAAYVHLGQIRLGMATEIETAKTVIDLYEQGLANCRTAEEVKELCGMLALARSQVAAAIQLGIEKFNMS